MTPNQVVPMIVSYVLKYLSACVEQNIADHNYNIKIQLIMTTNKSYATVRSLSFQKNN